jgi:hypothetical protein
MNMQIELPPLDKKAIQLLHFPTQQQAFLFRAFEYIPPAKIAAFLGITEEEVLSAAADMGLARPCTTNDWLEKGYITIIKRMWHLLPYDQLIRLLDTDKQTLAITMREDDFLDIKLGKKPICEPIVWRELTAEEQEIVMGGVEAGRKFCDETNLGREAELVEFFKGQGLSVYNADLDAFAEHVQAYYLESPTSAAWDLELLEQVKAMG